MQSLQVEHKVACLRLTTGSAKEEVPTNFGKTITTLLQSVLRYYDVKKVLHSKTKMGVELAFMEHIYELAGESSHFCFYSTFRKG